MLQIRDLSKSYGSKTLFEEAEVFLDEKSRTALIGPNGAGKSTLIRLILGQEHPDHGGIQLRKNMKIGHLAQELPKFENRTVFEEVLRLDGRREEILKEKAELEAKLETDHSDGVMNQYSRVLEEFDAFDEYRLPSRAEIILEGVGFAQKDYHRNLSELSGGWLMRVALARVLLLQPDLLILDEPTNHLDLESLLWLEEFLQNYPGAILIVSHDRAFVNRLVTSVWEIDQRKINPYAGNLDSYVIQKEERMRVMESERAGQDQKIAEMKEFVARFGAKATKARQAQSRMKQIEKIEAQLIELPESRDTVGFTFPPCLPSGKEVVTLKKAGMQFGEKTIFNDFDWILSRGSRVAIVGVNGAGKTTLLKALTQTIPMTHGTFKLGHQVVMGYYSQMQAETLDPNHTVYQELEMTAPHLTISQVRGVAGAFLFSGDAVEKKIKVLSGGEKARVALAKLLLLPNNFLLLDEPTNHLDSESRSVLLEALMNYQGTLCLVSHDRDFVSPLVDVLLEIDQQKVIPLVLNYEEYLEKKVRETRERMKLGKKDSGGKLNMGKHATETAASASSAKAASSAMGAAAGASLTPAVAGEVKAARPSNNQVRNWEKEFKTLERDIEKLEVLLGEINGRLSKEDFSTNQKDLFDLIDEQTKQQHLLDQKMSRWEALGELLNE